MKRVTGEDLNVGDVVYDFSKRCKLKLFTFDKVGDPFFEYVSGEDIFSYDENNLIPFFKDSTFYIEDNA